jgi:hypothetical protein
MISITGRMNHPSQDHQNLSVCASATYFLSTVRPYDSSQFATYVQAACQFPHIDSTPSVP